MVSLKSILVVIFVVVLNVGLAPTVAAVPSAKDSGNVVQPTDVKVDENLLHSSLRIGEAYNRGLLILCYSYPDPIESAAKLFTSTDDRVSFQAESTGDCERIPVSGTVSPNTELNHRLVPDKSYIGLNFLYEDVYHCSEGGEVNVVRYESLAREIVFTCTPPSEARVMWFGMNLFN